jgi:two-component system phosphate regulon response regulator PhoB
MVWGMAGPSSRAGSRILLVDADQSLSTPLSYTLEVAGFDVRAAGTGAEALAVIEECVPDIVLLEIMLPDISGIHLCRKIRSGPAHPRPAVIILTSRVEEADRIAGFGAGADDFVTKPFSISELTLRIRARLKARSHEEPPPPGPSESAVTSAGYIVLGPLVIDTASHRVFLRDEEVRLSAQEMRLLTYLAMDPGRMRSRRDLLTAVWGYHPDASSRTLDTHIKRLRDKFGPLAGMIQTAYGVGYRLVAVPPASSKR